MDFDVHALRGLTRTFQFESIITKSGKQDERRYIFQRSFELLQDVVEPTIDLQTRPKVFSFVLCTKMFFLKARFLKQSSKTHLLKNLSKSTFSSEQSVTLFRNRRFILDEMTQQNASKFAIFQNKKTQGVFRFSFHATLLFS